MAQSFEAVLEVIVKLAGDPISFKVLPGYMTADSKTPMSEHARLNYVKLR